MVPDLADDVFFTTKRVTVGYWGVGLLASGRPFESIGGSELDYGLSIATDINGNAIGAFRSYEEVRSFSAAANALELGENVLTAVGLEVPPLSRFADVGVGWTEKKTHVFLAPASVTQSQKAVRGNVTTHDSGVLFRVTPYNSIDYSGLVPMMDRIVALRVDVSHGRSTLNYDDARIAYSGVLQSDPVLRTHRTGWATRVALGLPSSVRDALKARGYGWLPDWITPLLAWGKAWDKEAPMVRDPATGFHRLGTRVMDTGWELTIANVYSVRKGHIDDPAGTIMGDTSGWSAGLHMKDVVGFSYDHATVPQSIYLGSVEREAFLFYVNPIKAWNALRNSREAAE